MVARVTLVGQRQFMATLTRLEKKILPRAKANALNRAATRGRKDAIADISRAEKRKKKAYRRAATRGRKRAKANALNSILRVTKRARAHVSMFAVVTLFARRQLHTGKLSKPFIAKGKEYRRRIPGKAWTTDRPRTSSPNLPIYPTVDTVAQRRERIMRANCEEAMKYFYPDEVRAQLDRLVRKHIRRYGR